MWRRSTLVGKVGLHKTSLQHEVSIMISVGVNMDTFCEIGVSCQPTFPTIENANPPPPQPHPGFPIH